MKNERAGVMVEMAIIAPVLALMLLGFVQIGLIVIAKIGIHNAATVAARYAVLDGVSKNQADIDDAVERSLPPTISFSDINIDYRDDYPIGTGTDEATRVLVTYDMPLMVPYVIPNSSGGILTIEAASIMR